MLNESNQINGKSQLRFFDRHEIVWRWIHGFWLESFRFISFWLKISPRWAASEFWLKDNRFWFNGISYIKYDIWYDIWHLRYWQWMYIYWRKKSVILLAWICWMCNACMSHTKGTFSKGSRKVNEYDFYRAVVYK